MTLEEALVAVWQQAMVEGAAKVEIGGKSFALERTPSKRLRQVDFVFQGEPLRGLEQNPTTRSRWAALARGGAKVMQFLSEGRYVGVVADGKVTMYSTAAMKRHRRGGGRKP